MVKLFEELKRRKVFKVAAVYAVAAWVLIQVADTVLPALQMPEWTVSFVTVLFFLGFPIAIILAWAYEVSPEGIRADAGILAQDQTSAPQSQRLVYATFILVLLAVGFQIADRFVLQQQVTTPASDSLTDIVTSATSNLTRRFEINLGVTVPRAGSLTLADVALSPDGRRLAIGLRRPDTPQQIYIQDLNQLQARPISGADGGDYPFFSPDGQWIAYTGSTSLRKISTQSGVAQELTDSYWRRSIWRSGSGFWSADGTVFYLTNDFGDRQLMKVAATGGMPELVPVDSQPADFTPSWPWLLPDGDSLLLTLAPGEAREGQIALLTLSTGDVNTVIQNGYNARYVPTGHIVFMRAASLWAVSFDPQRLEITGPEVPIIQGVHTSGNNGAASYTFSNDGLLVYLPGGDTTESDDGLLRTLLWVDRDGNEATLSQRRDFRRPVVSPDGQRLAVVVVENENADIWIYDLTRNTLSRLTFDEAVDYNPLWTPDGERVVFRSAREEGGLWWRAADGSGQVELLLTGNSAMVPSTFAPDGSQLVYDFDSDLYLLNLDGESPPRQLTQTVYQERNAAISHDGRWIAYESNETGFFEIYVRPFPDLESGKWQISNQTGTYPRWSRNDDELFFRSGSRQNLGAGNHIWTARVQTETTFQNDTPNIIVSGGYRGTGQQGAFDISADESQFLVIRGEGDLSLSEQTRLVAVENWFEELKRLAPPDSQ